MWICISCISEYIFTFCVMCVCVCVCLFSQGGQLVGLVPVLAVCHLIYVFSVVLHCISIHVVANKVLSLSYLERRSQSRSQMRSARRYVNHKPGDRRTIHPKEAQKKCVNCCTLITYKNANKNTTKSQMYWHESANTVEAKSNRQ